MPSLNIKGISGTEFAVEVEFSTTVADFKAQLQERCGIPPDEQRLIYAGQVLRDESSLDSYSLEDGHTLHMVRGRTRSTSSTDAQAAASQAQAGSQASGEEVEVLRAYMHAYVSNTGLHACLCTCLHTFRRLRRPRGRRSRVYARSWHRGSSVYVLCTAHMCVRMCVHFLIDTCRYGKERADVWAGTRPGEGRAGGTRVGTCMMFA